MDLVFEPTLSESVRWIETGDGYPLAVHHYAAAHDRGFLPVLMVHGLGANRHNFDLFGHTDAIPRKLAREGYHVYVLELRGVGMSRISKADAARYAQGIDAYLRHDLPAAVSYIRRTHQAAKVHWVGHSLGAILAYVYGATFPEHLQSLFSAGGPAPSFVRVPFRNWLIPIRYVIRGRRIQGAEIPNNIGTQVIKRLPNLVRRAYDKVLFHAENMSDVDIIRFGEHGLENIPLSVFRRLSEWVTVEGPHAGEVERALARLHVPTMFIAGKFDPLCEPRVITEAAKLMPDGFAETQVVSRETGFNADFGHGDLLASQAAVREIYPLILRFLSTHESRR